RGGPSAERTDQGRSGTRADELSRRRGHGDLADGEALVEGGQGLTCVLKEHAEVPGAARGGPEQQLRGNRVEYDVGVADRLGQTVICLPRGFGLGHWAGTSASPTAGNSSGSPKAGTRPGSRKATTPAMRDPRM